MKKNFVKLRGFPFYGFLIFLVSGCAMTQSKYQREYSKVWKETIKSQAWQESLIVKDENMNMQLYASMGNEMILAEESTVVPDDFTFEKKYQSLVSRAYFKIITEAEKADTRISAEYQLIMEQEQNSNAILDKSYRKKKEEAVKKYEAHRAMLSGLKSWNIFSEDRSGDLDYFKAENKESVHEMMQSNENNDRMINFLIYKLADLYHVEE